MSTFNKLYSCVLGLYLCVFFALSGAQAQTTLGAIVGEVSDNSGAIVSGAKITLTSNGTGLTRSTASGGNGSYAFHDLPVGVYTVAVSKESFDAQAMRHIRRSDDLQGRTKPSAPPSWPSTGGGGGGSLAF